MSLADPSAPSGSLTFSEFLDLLTGVVPEANGYVAICPAHNDSRPSLRVAYNPETLRIALKCRAGCETAAVLSELGVPMGSLFNVQPGDRTVRVVSTDSNPPSADALDALDAYLIRAQAADPGPALEYASRRFGITLDRYMELGLGFDDGTVDGGDLVLSRALYHDVPRLVVPFLSFDGQPQYLQARAIVEGDVRAKWSGPNNPDGATWAKYGYFKGGSGWNEVLVTEGPGDALTATAVGYDTVLIRGAGLGNNVALADELADGLRGRRVVVAGDADAAGAKFSRDVAGALSDRGVEVYRLTIPADGGNDLSKWRENAGSSFAKALVTEVQSAARYGSDEITAESIGHELTVMFSDVFNAETLLGIIRDDGGDVRFTPEAGFIVYRPDTGTWNVDVAEWVRTQAQRVAPRIQSSILERMQSLDARVASIDDPELRSRTSEMVAKMRTKARSSGLVSYVMSTRGIDSMIRELRVMPGVPASYEDFDQHPNLLAVANGVVDLETGELTPYGPMTKDLLLLRRVDTPYIPDARCPRWEEFVVDIFRDYPDVPAYMQRLVGYGITGHTTEQILAVFYGGGGNGKGVFIETLTGILKGISVTTPFSTFEAKPSGGIPNDIAAMKGSRLVMASEGEQGRPMAESLIKRLTGGDTISARFMRKEFFEFTPTFLIMLATNYRPNFRGQDYGLWRRVKLIPFDRKYEGKDRDPYLTAKLLGKHVPRSAYRPGEDYGDGPAGILAWAVRGAVRWYQDSLEDPEVVRRATAEFRETSDYLAEFYAAHLVKDPAGSITGQQAWVTYQDWCEEENLDRRERWKRTTFWKALEERGAVKRSRNGSPVFHGIRARRPSDSRDSDDSPCERIDPAPIADMTTSTPFD